MGFRINSYETDLSGYTGSSISEQGAMIIIGQKGKNIPVLCQTDAEVLDNAGYPSAEYPSVFEAVAYVRKAPLYVVAPYGVNSQWAGAYVQSGTVSSFTEGQVNPDSFDFANVDTLGEQVLGTGTGSSQSLTGSLSHTDIDHGSLVIMVNGVATNAEEAAGVVTGTGITGTLDVSTGAYSITMTATTGAEIKANYVYNSDMTASAGFAIFAASPNSTDEYAVNVISNGGKKFTLTLYTNKNGVYTYKSEYAFSLIREKDNFGKGLYYEDIFKDNSFITIKSNTLTSIVTYSLTSVDKIDLVGGYREAPLASDINAAWDHFQKANKYYVKNMMDVIGGYATKINSTIQNYQPHAQGLTTLTLGNSVANSISERQGLSLDSDDIGIYQGWMRIVDPYNNSYAWISNIGSAGAKYAMMSNVYDSGSPAGIDENQHGGQISDWQYIEADNDYSDSDLQNLDNAQINPIILDESYGAMIYGDKTAQASLSDTSFIGARRTYKFLIERITKDILKKQVFKNNDEYHRTKAKTMADDFILGTLMSVGALREFTVVCNDKNNNDQVLEQRRFVLDVYVKITPNAQTVQLNLTRVSQTTVISSIIPQ